MSSFRARKRYAFVEPHALVAPLKNHQRQVKPSRRTPPPSFVEQFDAGVPRKSIGLTQLEAGLLALRILRCSYLQRGWTSLNESGLRFMVLFPESSTPGVAGSPIYCPPLLHRESYMRVALTLTLLEIYMYRIDRD